VRLYPYAAGRLACALVAATSSLIGTLILLAHAPAYAESPVFSTEGAGPQAFPPQPDTANDSDPPTFPPNPLITPTQGITVIVHRPAFDWQDAGDGPGTGVVSYTLLLSRTSPLSAGLGLPPTSTFTATGSAFTPALAVANGHYSWTVRAHDAAGNASGYVEPETFVLAVEWFIQLPLVVKTFPEPACPTTSTAQFQAIPFTGPPTDRPDYLHGDLNLSLRGYAPGTGHLGLVDYDGATDPNAPRLGGLFEPERPAVFSTVYRANQWNFTPSTGQCEDNPNQGSRGPVIMSEWEDNITMVGMATTAGETIHIPDRPPEIFGGGFKALVLYAEETRITLSYIREDTIAFGYAVHLENVCVDPNLLALYRAQRDQVGCHVTGQLPALKENQALGTALGNEIQVAIRDSGTFMDPRSRKDWW
jgi:hypothetical protein